jgi:hypothetical protein
MIESNFTGSWDSLCQFCNKPQRDHISKECSSYEFIHRMPCEEEKQNITNHHQKMVSWIRVIFETCFWISILRSLVWIAVGILYYYVGWGITIFPIVWAIFKHYAKPEQKFPYFKNRYKKQQEKKSLIGHRMWWWDKYPKEFDKFKSSVIEKHNEEQERKNRKFCETP